MEEGLDKPHQSIRRLSEFHAVAKELEQRGRGQLPLLVLIDGIHRTMAREGVTNSITARVIDIGDLEEARWLAIVENWPHG